MYKAIFFVVSVLTNGSNVAFNGGHLAFISVYLVLQKLEKGFLDTAVDYKWDAAASKADLRHDFRLSSLLQFTLSSA